MQRQNGAGNIRRDAGLDRVGGSKARRPSVAARLGGNCGGTRDWNERRRLRASGRPFDEVFVPCLLQIEKNYGNAHLLAACRHAADPGSMQPHVLVELHQIGATARKKISAPVGDAERAGGIARCHSHRLAPVQPGHAHGVSHPLLNVYT